MEKIVLVTLLLMNLFGGDFEKKCLQCHIENQLPTDIIYRKYLAKYSTNERMKRAIFLYLKNPLPKNSIMPKPFFLKFKTKSPTKLNDKELERLIDIFLERYDIKKILQ
jgi:hypothetical protein